VCPLYDLDPGLGLNFGNKVIIIMTMVGQTRTDMDFGRLLIKWQIPQFHLSQSRNNAGSGTASTVQNAHEFCINILIALEISFPAIKRDHTAGAPDTDIIHGVFTPNNQNLLHTNLQRVFSSSDGFDSTGQVPYFSRKIHISRLN